ncbi:MAG: tetratricopeptide repeat protein [Planctomycetota bacterium]
MQNNLAVLYRNQGDCTAAATLNQEVLERRRAQFGERHPDTLGSFVNQGEFLLRGGNAADAREALDEALALCLEELGDENALTLHALMVLGSAASKLGAQEAALARAVYEAGDASWVSLQQAAELLLATGEADDAEQALSIARRLTDQQSVLRPEHQELLERCYLANSRQDDARRVLDKRSWRSPPTTA